MSKQVFSVFVFEMANNFCICRLQLRGTRGTNLYSAKFQNMVLAHRCFIGCMVHNPLQYWEAFLITL